MVSENKDDVDGKKVEAAEEYLKQNLNNHPLAALKNALLAAGYSEAEINEAEKKVVKNPTGVNPNNVTQPAPTGERLLDVETILQKAFRIPWKNKAFIFYGALVALLSGIGNGGGDWEPTEEKNQASNALAAASNYADNFTNLVSPSILVLLVIFVIIVFAVVIVLGNWGYAAIINGVLKLEDGAEAVTRKEMGRVGKKTVWRLILLNFFIPLTIILALVAVFFSLMLLGQMALVIIIPLVIFLIPVFVYFSVVWKMAARFIVAEGASVFGSVSRSIALLKGHFWMTFLYTILSGLITCSGSCLGGILFFVFLILTIIAATSGAVVLALISGILTLGGFLVYLFVAGYFHAFDETGNTLWWKDLNKIKNK